MSELISRSLPPRTLWKRAIWSFLWEMCKDVTVLIFKTNFRGILRREQKIQPLESKWKEISLKSWGDFWWERNRWFRPGEPVSPWLWTKPEWTMLLDTGPFYLCWLSRRSQRSHGNHQSLYDHWTISFSDRNDRSHHMEADFLKSHKWATSIFSW